MAMAIGYSEGQFLDICKGQLARNFKLFTKSKDSQEIQIVPEIKKPMTNGQEIRIVYEIKKLSPKGIASSFQSFTKFKANCKGPRAKGLQFQIVHEIKKPKPKKAAQRAAFSSFDRICLFRIGFKFYFEFYTAVFGFARCG